MVASQRLGGIEVNPVQMKGDHISWRMSVKEEMHCRMSIPTDHRALLQGMLQKVHTQLSHSSGPLEGSVSLRVYEGTVEVSGRVTVYGERANALFGCYLTEAFIVMNGIAKLYSSVVFQSKIWYTVTWGEPA